MEKAPQVAPPPEGSNPQTPDTGTREQPGAKGISRMRAVTVSREYGSGGGEIAARLAARLGWHLVNHEVIVEVARALGVSESEAEAYDEHAATLAARILSSLSYAQSAIAAPIPVPNMPNEMDYNEARTRVVNGAVAAGHAVIVGRGAQVLLASRHDVLHVRIIAPMEQRISYVMQRENLDHQAAQQRIERKERDRAHFLMSVHHKNPADAQLYDLVVNTGVISLDSVVDLLVLALESKAKQLAVPDEAIGPGTGLSPYSGTPGDIGPHLNEDAE